MSSNWKNAPLGELVSIKGGKRLPKGKNLQKDRNEHPYIRVRDMHDGRITPSELLYVPDNIFPKISRFVINSGDVFISIVGTIGLVGIISDDLDNANLTENAAKLTKFSDELLPKFLYYFLNSTLGQNQIHALTVGTTQRKLALKRVAMIEVPLPPLEEQKRIADILGTLDDKIELNRQMNRTLEAMARAIFKSWFVDFDPVYSKMESRAYPLPAEVLDLFPDELVESELGLIPKGWEVGKVGDVYEFAYGKSLTQKKRIPGKYSVYGSNGIIGTHNKAIVEGPGIILGRKGNPGTVTWAANDFFPIDTTFYIITNLPMLFAFYQLDYLDLSRLSADSAVPGLNRNIAYLEEITLPNDEILNAFEMIIIPFYDKINLNNIENKTLIAIRDTLLPKLMDNEVEVLF